MRSSHSLAFKQFEEIISNIRIESISSVDSEIENLIKENSENGKPEIDNLKIENLEIENLRVENLAIENLKIEKWGSNKVF
mgnify:CR=1 FL=1